MIKEHHTELTEDMEVVGPGQMLKEARLALKLTAKDVALKLNFTVALIENIEKEDFDNRLPRTYMRGYLKNYAKLVHVSCEDVLASYELLGVAAVQQAEMQSFSQSTKKQAENSRLMWFSYFILAILVGLTVIWWQQEHQQDQTAITANQNEKLPFSNTRSNNSKEIVPSVGTTPAENDNAEVNLTPQSASIKQPTEAIVDNIQKVNAKGETANLVVQSNVSALKESAASNTSTITPLISDVVFTFSGDCWVNIYDATGERIAWGIKKADYVMTIKGKAPFAITLGKPELVSIRFDGKDVNMSQFGAGNIAKFSLPLKP
ncbi:MAG: DUF4115 domain-containing protein [Alteromonadaceae bacterium]|nr:DUF4115 domain-containing protein [Alteromonadaceae bacterium]